MSAHRSFVGFLAVDVFEVLESFVRFVFARAVCHMKRPRLGVPMSCR